MSFVPARRRGVEILDDPAVDDATRQRSLDEVARSNRWLGGRRAVRLALAPLLRQGGGTGAARSLLDVGTGAGDLARLARQLASRSEQPLHVVGVDLSESLLRSARTRGDVQQAAVADAMRLPFHDGAFDIVLCSQLLHHFEEAQARALLRELHRVAKDQVIVADLRRSWIAATGFWLISWPLGFGRVTRHDGVVSVLRGFTARELHTLAREATTVTPRVVRRWGWRLVAQWGSRDSELGARRTSQSASG